MERIAQISNDISEDMCRAKSKELVEVVRYYRDQADRLFRCLSSLSEQIEVTMLEHVMGSEQDFEPDPEPDPGHNSLMKCVKKQCRAMRTQLDGLRRDALAF